MLFAKVRPGIRATKQKKTQCHAATVVMVPRDPVAGFSMFTWCEIRSMWVVASEVLLLQRNQGTRSLLLPIVPRNC